MKVALVQYNPIWEDRIANKEKIRSLLENTEQTDLFVFPEMTLTGFTMKSKDFAEGLDGDTFKYFSELAKEKKSAIFYGVIEKGRHKNFNTLIHINNQGRVINMYRKVHPFSFSSENIFYGRGKSPAITKIKGLKIGLSICYDLRFPELFRYYAKERVDLIVNIANWPDSRVEHWRTLLKARAIENQCYLIGVNRVGDDPKLHYNGFSSCFDPMGKEIISIENDEKTKIIDIDKTYVKEIRNKLPFLEDIYLI